MLHLLTVFVPCLWLHLHLNGHDGVRIAVALLVAVLFADLRLARLPRSGDASLATTLLYILCKYNQETL